MLFIEVSVGVKRCTPPKMIQVNQLKEWQGQYQSSELELFSSICQYPTDDPYVGGVISPFYIDLDCEETPDKARKEAVALIKKLITDYGIPEANINIAFSGMKGFSITIDPALFNAECLDYLPLIWKSIVEELKNKLKLKTVDLAVYERRRLWRLLNSRHQKTGRFKIPITLPELEKLTIDEIKERAVEPRELLIKSYAQAIPKAEKLFLEHKAKIEGWINERKKTFDITELKAQTDDPPCVKRLLEKGAETGNRNNCTFDLAVYYANKGVSYEETSKLCQEFALKSEAPLDEREVETLVDSAFRGVESKRYSIGCSSETLAGLCDKEACPFFNVQIKFWNAIGEPIAYDEWKKTILCNFPHLWPYVEVCASTVAILLINDTQPFALVLQGVPSGGKTTTLDFFKGFPYSHATDKFTPRSFVSHVAQKSEAELNKIDLLPRIKGRVLITADLTTLFGAKSEELKETFSLLTRVLDGRGLTIDSGVYGARGYSGDYMFTWIGATTPIPHSVWDLFGNLGARMYFMQILSDRKSNSSYVNNLKQKSYRKRVEECNQATLRFLKGIWRDERIDWNSANESAELLELIVLVAKVVTRLRGKTNVAIDPFTKEAHHSEVIIEEPDRCIQALYTLARGHALIQGRTQITIADLPVVMDVGLSSAPWERVKTFAYLLSKPDASVTTSELAGDFKWARSTAIRAMKTLEILELVDLTEESVQTKGGLQTGYVMRLKEAFRWFKSPEFQKLWRLKPKKAVDKQTNKLQLVPEKTLLSDTCSAASANRDQGAIQ